MKHFHPIKPTKHERNTQPIACLYDWCSSGDAAHCGGIDTCTVDLASGCVGIDSCDTDRD